MFLKAAVLVVMTSSPILKDLIKSVGGDQVEVINVVETMRDPHHFDPTFKTLQNFKKAGLAVFVGNQYESWSKDLIAKSKFQGEVIQLSEKINSSNKDSHFWLNPDLTRQAASLIASELIKLSPEHKSLFETRSKIFQDQILDKSRKLKEKFQTLPKEKKRFVVESNSFLHWCDFFELDCLSITSRSHRSEVTGKELSEARKKVLRQPRLFYIYESHHSKPLSEQRAKDLGLLAVGPVSVEMLGDPSTLPTSYLELLEQNAQVLLTQIGEKPVSK